MDGAGILTRTGSARRMMESERFWMAWRPERVLAVSMVEGAAADGYETVTAE